MIDRLWIYLIWWGIWSNVAVVAIKFTHKDAKEKCRRKKEETIKKKKLHVGIQHAITFLSNLFWVIPRYLYSNHCIQMSLFDADSCWLQVLTSLYGRIQVYGPQKADWHPPARNVPDNLAYISCIRPKSDKLSAFSSHIQINGHALRLTWSIFT